jgi:hypothetical protein
MPLETKKDGDAVTVLASTTQTGVGTGNGTTDVYLPGMVNGMAFVLDLTAAATDANDTLNVFVQTKIDKTNWLDVVHFTECLGDGGALRYVAKINADIAQAEFEVATALGAAAVRNLLGDVWRVRWAVVDPTGANAAFTFGVTACPM